MLNTSDRYYFAAKPTNMARWPVEDQKNNINYEAVVQSVSPIDYLKGTCTVYIPHLNTYTKANVNLKDSSFFLGCTNSVKPGDHIKINFSNGKSEFPTVTSISNVHRSDQYLAEEELRVPQYWTLDEEGTSITATSNAYIPDVAKYGFKVNGIVYDFPGFLQENQGSIIYNEMPGSAVWDMLGDYNISPMRAVNLTATKINTEILSPRVDPVSFPIIDAQRVLKYYIDLYEKSKPRFISAYNRTPILETPTATANVGGDYSGILPYIPLAKEGIKYSRELVRNWKNSVFKQAKEEVKTYSKEEKCTQKNIDEGGRVFSEVFGFLGGVLLPYALEAVNNILPADLQINIEKTGSLLVGPIKYDPNTGDVEFNGNTFSGLISQELDQINGLFPSWLGINITADSIGLGDTQVSISDILSGKTNLSLGDFAIENRSGQVLITLDGQTIADVTSTITQVTNTATTGLLGSGISNLNQQLPDGFKLKLGFNKSGNPTMSLGPISITPFGPNAGISLDQATLEKALQGLLGSLIEPFFTQFPAPLQALGRALWRKVDIGQLFIDSPKNPWKEANEIYGVIRSATFSCVTNADPNLFKTLATGPVTVSTFPLTNLNGQFEIKNSADNIGS